MAKRGLVSDESEISHARDDLPKEENSGSRQIRWKLIESKKGAEMALISMLISMLMLMLI